jgi:hypothetical protein
MLTQRVPNRLPVPRALNFAGLSRSGAMDQDLWRKINKSSVPLLKPFGQILPGFFALKLPIPSATLVC